MEYSASFNYSIVIPWWLRWYIVCQQCERPGFYPWVRRICWRRNSNSLILRTGKVHGWRSLVDYSPWGFKEEDTTEQLHFAILIAIPQITADGDCSHGIKRHLLLRRKATTNLDSIFKSRDITCQQRSIESNYGFSSSHVWM